MTILGIDPGYHRCGYGLIKQQGQDLIMVDYGCIETDPDLPHAQRLSTIHDQIKKIIKQHNPAKVGVEELFFAKNTKTALKVAQARGVILLTAERCGIPIIEITPNQVKQAITGYGGADKRQIQEMVKIMLKLDEIPQPDDAADALAVAITASRWNPFSNLQKMRYIGNTSKVPNLVQ